MSLTPYLAVADARAAIAFYVEALGGTLRGEPVVMDDGRVGHAEVELGGSVLMLADEYPELGLLGPKARGGVSQSLHLTVDDVDGVVARALAAGAALEREATDAPYGRTAVLTDPAGHRWMVQSLPAGAARGAPDIRHGDIAYVTHRVPDAARAKAFYGKVLGWTFRPGSAPAGWDVEGVRPMSGFWGGQADAEVRLCYRVDDLAAAVARVREAGGTVEEPEDRPSGQLVSCTDDSGAVFQLWQPPRS